MLFKNSFERNPALRYVYEQLQLVSNLGRNRLLNLPFCTDRQLLESEFERLSSTIALLENEAYKTKITHIRTHLHQVNDIHPTLAALQGGAVLDDIQLFEIKKTALLTRKIADDLAAIGCTFLPLENTDPVFVLLDPEHTNIPHFHIYAAYDPELSKWRERIQLSNSASEAEEFRFQAQKVEDRVRTRLSEQLRPHCASIAHNLETLAHLDLLMAKARLALDWKACRPSISDRTDLQRLSNPEIASALKDKGRVFQPIDIRFGNETILVTGANMAGKSVLLKTISLAQHLFQFGFYIPAESASMCIVDDILSSIGDGQSEISGLSSFAVEILTINQIIREGRNGRKVLALVDELARTTNPEEGKRIVSNFVQLTQKLGITALVTTHYSGITGNCRRLRVKGLQLKDNQIINASNISDYMDYTLVETDVDEVPMEAFTVARLLGVDEELLKS